mmetsp:Transcript_77573/g.137330  ORF Transcript_77573/g.137330 Transcript_77573/m.137330 type:complete len:979 (-) Transcript_77573:62-2998(-)
MSLLVFALLCFAEPFLARRAQTKTHRFNFDSGGRQQDSKDFVSDDNFLDAQRLASELRNPMMTNNVQLDNTSLNSQEHLKQRSRHVLSSVEASNVELEDPAESWNHTALKSQSPIGSSQKLNSLSKLLLELNPTAAFNHIGSRVNIAGTPNLARPQRPLDVIRSPTTHMQASRGCFGSGRRHSTSGRGGKRSNPSSKSRSRVTDSSSPRVAVLGGTISGTIAARQIALSGVSVDLFRNLNDPKRAISSMHPLCEYEAATFVLRDDDSSDFEQEVKRWLDLGLVEDIPKFWFGQIDANGKAQEAQTPGRRLMPRGGFFSLIDSLIADLPDRVDVRAEQLVKMSRDADKWLLHDRDGVDFGKYDSVICAFDALPRAARKASQKQLLESALPHANSIIASAARAQMCSSMTVVLHFDPPLEVPYDSILFKGVPELQFATRNFKKHQKYRGINEKYDTWTVVSTPAWSFQQRSNHKGKWNKKKVGGMIIKAFCDAVGGNPMTARQIIPTFHMQGASYITQIQKGEPCAFDAKSGLGWCGDMFGGTGPAGAVNSGLAAAKLVAASTAGKRTSVLPGEAEWGLRNAREGDEDIASIVGPGTGRAEPKDGLDHTWETAVRIARGANVQAADSYKQARKFGAIGEDRYGHEDGPWTVPLKGNKPRAASTMSTVATRSKPQAVSTTSRVPRLQCTKVADGILKVAGLPADVQSELLRSVFPQGARGKCGGLYSAKSGMIELQRGKAWSVTAGSKVDWSDLGLHGSHTVQLEKLGGSVVSDVLQSIKEAAPKVLGDFSPDSLRVAFENMHGRSIQPGKTLCGWSRDRDRVGDNDGDPKVCIILGSSKISHGYKKRKSDQESLDVGLRPGDVLVIYGPGRSWFSAVNGFQREESAERQPFDFAHIWLQDHRRLQKLRPNVYSSIHHPPTPAAGSPDYKWMQFLYTVTGERSPDGSLLVEMSDSTSAKGAGGARSEAKVEQQSKDEWVIA